MANLYFFISEEKFHLDKDGDPNVRSFIEETGIDLGRENRISRIPSIFDIRNAIADFGLNIVNETRDFNNLEFHISGKGTESFVLLFSQVVDEADHSVFMFELERGSDFEMAVNFIKFLSRSVGNFLFYCDSGSMSLITPNKDFQDIINEMSS